MKEHDRFDILEDIRARVIYYSCLVKPKNILEISELWDYKTSTYFYQKRSKAVIKEMEARKLISTVKGARFASNYDLLLEQNEMMKFFEKTNNLISNQIIIEEFEWEVTENQLEDPLFREFCLEKKPELKDTLSKARITSKDIEGYISLWKTFIFRKMFLSADSIKSVLEDRYRLPKDPREFLFSTTINLCEVIYAFKKASAQEFVVSEFPNPYLWVEIDKILPLVVTKLKSYSDSPEKLESFSKRFQDMYPNMVKKFEVFEDKIELKAHHTAKLIEILGV